MSDPATLCDRTPFALLSELSPALLQPQVTVVAILGELLDTLPGRDEMRLFMYPGCFYRDLEDFARELRATLYRTDDFWRRRNVTSSDDDPPTSLSQALAAYESTPGTTWDHVTMAASMWQWSVSVLGDSWVRLARKASRLRNTYRKVATEADTKAATTTSWARELQDEAARYGTALENMVELGQALGREEGAKVVARTESQLSPALLHPPVTVVAILGELLATLPSLQEVMKLLITSCLYEDLEGFTRELRDSLRHISDPWWRSIFPFDDDDPVASLSRALDVYKSFPLTSLIRVPRMARHWEGLVSVCVNSWARLARKATELCNTWREVATKVAEAKRLWVASVRLAKDHLVGAVDNIIEFCFDDGPDRASARRVADQCHRAIEDIPNLLQG
ncbi:unnamed protein product [Coccothraustes coccothraustes]